MQPIVFKLPVILSKPIDNQLLTLYLIRSNCVNKEPYDPNYAKRTRKRSPSPSPIRKSKKLKKKSSKSSPRPKNGTSKSKAEKVKKSKSKPVREVKKSSKSKSSSQPVSSTPNHKVSRKSSGAGGYRSSQVLSVPSTSKATSNQYKGISKTTPPKRKHSDGHSSSSKSVSGTPSTSKSDSTAPRTPLKVNQLNHSVTSPPKIKKHPPICVPEPFRHFKIPKKPKLPAVDDKIEIPKRLQPSGYSPVDLIIGSGPISSPTVKQNPLFQCQSAEDFDALEEAEPELDFDLYGGEESLSQLAEDFSSEFNGPSIRQEDDQREEEKESTSAECCQDDPLDQTLPPVQSRSLLKQLDDESESSDDEGNFKRRGARERQKSESEVTVKTGRECKISLLTIQHNHTPTTQLETRPQPIPMNKSETSKIISLRPSSSSKSRPPIPPSLSPRLLASSPPRPSQPISSTPSASSSETAESLITNILNIKSTDEAMKTFIGYSYRHSSTFASDPQSFQTLFRTLLLNLFLDTNFILSDTRFGVLLKMMQQLGMDESHHWEKIICSWGRHYQSLVTNPAKLENIIKVSEFILDHLQLKRIPINLSTAKLLYAMNMAKNEDH